MTFQKLFLLFFTCHDVDNFDTHTNETNQSTANKNKANKTKIKTDKSQFL